MKIKNFTTLLSLILLGAVIPIVVSAQNLISVEFIPDPLIYATDFLPGDTVSGQIKVDNISGQTINVYMWTTDVSDVDRLGAVLELEISDGQNTIYQSPLSQLFAEDSVLLATLAFQEIKTFNFSLKFDINAGNEYQNKTLGFNFHIGTEENQQEDENDEGENGGGSTPIIVTGGGGVVLPELEIINLRAENITQTGATIKWQTNMPATTQIIYSSEHQSHHFSPSAPPLYGYKNIFPVPEDGAKIIFHTLNLENLSPCTIYYFRAISHNSSIAISEEKSFQTTCSNERATETTSPQESEGGKEGSIEELEESKSEPISGSGSNSQSPTAFLPQGLVPQTSGGANENPPSYQETLPIKISQGGDYRIQPGFFSLLLANINNAFNLKGLGCAPWWAILFLVLYSLFKAYLSFSRSRKKGKEGNDFLKKRYRIHTIIWLVWAMFLFLLMLVSIKICTNLLILILLMLITVLLFLRLKEIKNTQRNQQKLAESYPQFAKS